VHTEPGEAEVLRDAAGELVLAVVEVAGRERHRTHALVVDHVNRHGAVVVQAGMKELHLEREALVLPQRPFGTEADVTPLIIGDLGEPGRDFAARILEGLLGELLGTGGDIIEGKRWRGGKRSSSEEQADDDQQ
jgi:hypothetical protein